MIFPEKIDEFKSLLIEQLPTSSGDQRKEFAKHIIEQTIPLNKLKDCLWKEPKLSSRFLWLLSDIGNENPAYLHSFLPQLIAEKDKIVYPKYPSSLAYQFIIAGVPISIEGEVLDLVFTWLSDSKTAVTTKSRALKVAQNLMIQYPEIKGELRVVLENIKHNKSDNFSNKIQQVLNELK